MSTAGTREAAAATTTTAAAAAGEHMTSLECRSAKLEVMMSTAIMRDAPELCVGVGGQR
jgi:hypothetical protein